MWESVNHIGLTSTRNVFGFDPDKVVRHEAVDRFELGKKPAVILVEQAREEQIPRRLDIVFRFVGIINLREKHAEDMVARHVLGNDFEAGLIYLIRLIAEDELLVIVGFLHGSLHRRDLGVSFLDRFDDILLLVGIVCACIGGIQFEEI